MADERLQKIIARAGVTSRRKAEALIAAGRVAVNGEVVRELGTRADPERDVVTLDGRPLFSEPARYLVVNKPRGVLCALRDRFERPLIGGLLGDDVRERVYPAGRLDFDSEGLVLLTNDGELMQAITRPGRGVAKVYDVTVERSPGHEDLESLENGVLLDGQITLPCTIEPLGDRRFLVTLHEGKKNQIRRMFALVDAPVLRLVRVAIGPLRLDDLRTGEYRSLTQKEVESLRREVRKP